VAKTDDHLTHYRIKSTNCHCSSLYFE